MIGTHECGRSKRRSARASRIEIFVLAAALVAVVAAAACTVDVESDPPATMTVKAHQGDTAWSLAKAHPVDGLSTAQTAAMIIRINDVVASRLPAGQSIRVPAQADQTVYAMR
ncbi:MAG: hypothetical protein CVT67_00380 [Actinobacteria bacterium HGW-Actinobacteria-7]|jgi:LysM repeat protein|nr:MAG: hypothetical protein CVT67_00380 [Actinobacteria bacterium HGW-Actinobacteria-7]